MGDIKDFVAARGLEVLNGEGKDPEAVLVMLKEPSESLWSIFYNHLPSINLQRTWNCRTCQRFVRTYGTLALLTQDNRKIPLLWGANADAGQIPTEYRASFLAMTKALSNQPIQQTYAPALGEIGQHQLGGFTHFFFQFPDRFVQKRKSGEHANVAEDKEILDRVVASAKWPSVQLAYELITNDKLPHADKHKRHISLLHTLVQKINHAQHSSTPPTPTPSKVESVPPPPAQKGEKDEKGEKERIDMLVWKAAVSGGPSVIRSLRNGVVGKLLDDLDKGLPMEDVKKNWSDMTSPENYMRPKALPSQNLVKEAEKLFAELKITDHDLKRALLPNVPLEKCIWHLSKKTEDHKTSSQLFGLIPKKECTEEITLTNFLQHIVPGARSIELKLSSTTPAPFYQFIQAYAGGEKGYPMMQWHTATNSVSWYTYPARVLPAQFGLVDKQWVTVTDICRFPHLWDTPTKFTHFGEHRYLLVLEGCRDSKFTQSGLCLFPEFLKSEFHPYRSVIEQYNKTHTIDPTPAPPIAAAAATTASVAPAATTPASAAAASATATTASAAAAPAATASSAENSGVVAGVAMEKTTENKLGYGPFILRVTNKLGNTTIYTISNLK